MIGARLEAKKTLMRTLYHEPYQIYQEAIKTIVKKNNKLNNATGNLQWGKFTYKGQLYSCMPAVKYLYCKTLELHPSLQPDFEKIEKHFVGFSDEVKKSDRFISILLTFIRNHSDAEYLLGSLAEEIKPYTFQLDGDPRDPEELKEFKQTNQPFISRLLERQVENALMRNIDVS
jgi:hypothetical protein